MAHPTSRRSNVKHGLAVVLCVLVAAVAAHAAVPVRTMYNDALAREQAVRVALEAPSPSADVLTAVRAAIARYEAVVRRFPASSYCDNALWQAAQLAADAFAKFNQPADRETAARLLRRLAEGYPSSRLAAQVPDRLARLESTTPRRDLVAAALPARVDPPQPQIQPQPSLQASATRPAPAAPDLARSKAAPKIATIRDIRRTLMPEAVRVIIELDGEVPFRDERIPDPSRVFVDLPGTRPASQLVDQTLRFEGDADLVRQVRIGRHPNNTTRVVLDANGISSYSVYPLYDPYRLVIDCVRAATLKLDEPTAIAATALPEIVGRKEPPLVTRASAPVPVTARRETPPPPSTPPPPPVPAAPVRRDPPLLAARPSTTVWLRTAPAITPQHTLLMAEAYASIAEALAPPPAGPLPATRTAPAATGLRADSASSAPAAGLRAENASTAPAGVRADGASTTAESASTTTAESTTSPPTRNSTGRFSIARQLGLGVSRIVIDAGHGGHDPGAQGRGVVEAELVLDVALRVEKLLQKVPGVEVILTRRADEFVHLQERTAIANREGADLFLSIHANASQSAQAHGIETYFLNFASNLSAAAVAARENAASGQAMGALPDIVKAIALNNKLDESRDFAAQVQHAMIERLRPANKTLKDLGVKQAPFVVLIGAAMPSVLAEISFVTNPQEAKLLKGNAYRQRIADALFDAIRKYQTSLKGATAVATPQ